MATSAVNQQSTEGPRFYEKDIILLLDEKNKLKERVLELEEEVEDLKM